MCRIMTAAEMFTLPPKNRSAVHIYEYIYEYKGKDEPEPARWRCTPPTPLIGPRESLAAAEAPCPTANWTSWCETDMIVSSAVRFFEANMADFFSDEPD